MHKKTNVVQLEVENGFDTFDEVAARKKHKKPTSTIEVEPSNVHIETQPNIEKNTAESQEYAHHSAYNENYKSPEIPQMAMPYTSSKAKTFMTLFSLSLIVITASFVDATQNKMKDIATERQKYQSSLYRAENQKDAKTMDMLQLNTIALEESMAKMGEIVNNRKALVEVETALRKQSSLSDSMSDKQARDLLIRAGYQPSQINAKQMASFKKNYKGVSGDVDFARDVAGDIVQEEVESFVHKMKLISNVGEYIYNRTKD